MSNEKYIHPLDFENNIALGLDIPITSDNNTFFSLNYTTEDQTRANLKNLILTNKGERIMSPNYGTDLKKMIFEQAPQDKIEDNIRESIKTWLPYVNIEELIVSDSSLNEHLINISLKYSVLKDEDSINELNFELYSV